MLSLCRKQAKLPPPTQPLATQLLPTVRVFVAAIVTADTDGDTRKPETFALVAVKVAAARAVAVQRAGAAGARGMRQQAARPWCVCWGVCVVWVGIGVVTRLIKPAAVVLPAAFSPGDGAGFVCMGVPQMSPNMPPSRPRQGENDRYRSITHDKVVADQ